MLDQGEYDLVPPHTSEVWIETPGRSGNTDTANVNIGGGLFGSGAYDGYASRYGPFSIWRYPLPPPDPGPTVRLVEGSGGGRAGSAVFVAPGDEPEDAGRLRLA